MKASQCFSSSVKTVRSANRSSASLSAVSRTNSLTDLRATVAAACNVCFADLVSRRSSFSVLFVE